MLSSKNPKSLKTIQDKSPEQSENQLIGVLTSALVQDSSWNMFAYLLGIIQEEARRYGYQVTQADFNRDFDLAYKLADKLVRENVAGIIYHPISSEYEYSKNKEIIEVFERQGIPVVLIDKYFTTEPDNYSYVSVENYQGSYEITQHLINLGHTYIAFIRYPASSTVMLREQGFRRALLESGIRCNENWVRVIQEAQQISEICSRIFNNTKQTPTAIFTSSDTIARHFYLCLAKQGIRIPQDVAVVGFDDLPSAARMNPPLTTVRQPFEEEARYAVKFLMERIKKYSRLPHIILPCEVMVRKSCGAGKQRKKSFKKGTSPPSEQIKKTSQSLLKKDSKVKLVGLLVREVSDLLYSDIFYSKVIKGIEEVAQERGVQLLFSIAFKEKQEEYSAIKKFLRSNIRGLIFVATYDFQPPAQEELVYLYRRRIPFVSASALDNRTVSFAGVDDQYGGFLAAERLIKTGRRKIGALLAATGDYAGNKRFQGIIDAINAFNLAPQDIYIFRNELKQSLSIFKSAYLWGKSLDLKAIPIEGIICHNDHAAHGLIKAFRERQIKIPDDIAIIGYEDSGIDDRDVVPLTTIHIPNHEIGRKAMKILLQHLEGKTEPIQTLLKPNLIVRQSG